MSPSEDVAASPAAEPAPQNAASHTATRWIVIAVVAVALVLFIAWARRTPPFDDRVRDEDGTVVLVVDATHRGGS